MAIVDKLRAVDENQESVQADILRALKDLRSNLEDKMAEI